MNMFKEASRTGLRVETPVGNLSTEQLWGLNLTQLDALAVKLQEEYKTSNKKSFIVKTTVKDKLAKLRFDIVLEILTTKMEEANEVASAQEDRKHNEKILSLIADKQDEDLKGKSIADLKKLLK